MFTLTRLFHRPVVKTPAPQSVQFLYGSAEQRFATVYDLDGPPSGNAWRESRAAAARALLNARP